MPKVLAVVGGGPKAAAIVARAATLRALLGADKVPEILVFERNAVGSAWSGDGGYSSGHLTLCSPAEKDVGFPYSEVRALRTKEPVAPLLHARFSWSSFLVATGGFSEWVDRGRDYPSHRLWADYLAWVFLQADQGVVAADVLDVTPQKKGGWHVRYRADEGEATVFADGVVLTGTGKSRDIRADATALSSGRVFNAETFWAAREEILEYREIAIAGAGGAAGAIIAWLCRALDERSGTTLRSISPMGTLFPRGDGYAERRWFSDPSDWRELSLADRKKLVERTEGGVISLRNKQTIDAARNISFVRGHAGPVIWDGSELGIEISYDRRPSFTFKADCLINAVGFDTWSLLELVKASSVKGLLRPGESALREAVAEAMGADLSFAADAGLGAGLHVPSLAALARGPGMGTLGCLGLVARSVLESYLD